MVDGVFMSDCASQARQIDEFVGSMLVFNPGNVR